MNMTKAMFESLELIIIGKNLKYSNRVASCKNTIIDANFMALLCCIVYRVNFICGFFPIEFIIQQRKTTFH